MSRRILSRETIRKHVISDMETLGVYKKEYRDLIEIYVDTYHDYLQARKDFEDSGRKYESETANGNPKKSAIVDSLEKLRKDILAYSDRLCLSPKSLERVSAEKESGSALAKALNKLE